MKFTPRLQREHYIHYTASDNFMSYRKPGFMTTVRIIIRNTIRWWFK